MGEVSRVFATWSYPPKLRIKSFKVAWVSEGAGVPSEAPETEWWTPAGQKAEELRASLEAEDVARAQFEERHRRLPDYMVRSWDHSRVLITARAPVLDEPKWSIGHTQSGKVILTLEVPHAKAVAVTARGVFRRHDHERENAILGVYGEAVRRALGEPDDWGVEPA